MRMIWSWECHLRADASWLGIRRRLRLLVVLKMVSSVSGFSRKRLRLTDEGDETSFSYSLPGGELLSRKSRVGTLLMDRGVACPVVCFTASSLSRSGVSS